MNNINRSPSFLSPHFVCSYCISMNWPACLIVRHATGSEMHAKVGGAFWLLHSCANLQTNCKKNVDSVNNSPHSYFFDSKVAFPRLSLSINHIAKFYYSVWLTFLHKDHCHSSENHLFRIVLLPELGDANREGGNTGAECRDRRDERDEHRFDFSQTTTAAAGRGRQCFCCACQWCSARRYFIWQWGWIAQAGSPPVSVPFLSL